jgi:hypothetical protein
MGGPFIYDVRSSLYSRNVIAYWTMHVMYAIHPLVLVLAVIGIERVLWARAQPRNDCALLLATTLVYATVLHMLLSALPRYGFPFFTFLYLAAVYALGELVRWLADWRRPRLSATP